MSQNQHVLSLYLVMDGASTYNLLVDLIFLLSIRFFTLSNPQQIEVSHKYYESTQRSKQHKQWNERRGERRNKRTPVCQLDRRSKWRIVLCADGRRDQRCQRLHLAMVCRPNVLFWTYQVDNGMLFCFVGWLGCSSQHLWNDRVEPSHVFIAPACLVGWLVTTFCGCIYFHVGTP